MRPVKWLTILWHIVFHTTGIGLCTMKQSNFNCFSFEGHTCCGFASICDKRTMQLLSHSFPLPGWTGRRIRRKKTKTLGVGWEQFNRMAKGEENNKSITLIKSMYNMQCSHHPMLSLLLSNKSLSSSQLPTEVSSMPSHGREYPIWLAVWVSPASFLWKLTLSQLNPGQHLYNELSNFSPQATSSTARPQP